MKSWVKLIVLISVCMPSLICAMPRSPVKLTLHTLETNKAERRVTMQVEAEARLATRNLAIAIIPPRGSRIIEGKLNYRGPARPGKPVVLKVTVVFPHEKANLVRAVARVDDGTGRQFPAHASQVVLFDKKPKKPPVKAQKKPQASQADRKAQTQNAPSKPLIRMTPGKPVFSKIP
jgi:hypothetical protein